MILRVKNWAEFQHYKNRTPPWLKLHRGLLDDYDWHRLPDASKALAPMLWLLASEYEDGVIDSTVEEIAFRLRTVPEKVDAALKPLIDAGFFILERDASAVIASRERDACSEREGETEAEREGDARARAAASKVPRSASVASAPSARPTMATYLPDGWQPGEDDIAWATKARPDLDRAAIDTETERFRNHAKAQNRTAFAWGPAWRNWISKAEARQQASPGGGATPAWRSQDPPPTAAHDTDDQWRARLRGYKHGGWWLGDWGPRAESGHCRAPKHILDEWQKLHGAGTGVTRETAAAG